jgi:hypothetical protein
LGGEDGEVKGIRECSEEVDGGPDDLVRLRGVVNILEQLENGVE